MKKLILACLLLLLTRPCGADGNVGWVMPRVKISSTNLPVTFVYHMPFLPNNDLTGGGSWWTISEIPSGSFPAGTTVVTNFEFSFDNGLDWFPSSAVGNAAPITFDSSIVNPYFNGNYGGAGGFTDLRVEFSGNTLQSLAVFYFNLTIPK